MKNRAYILGALLLVNIASASEAPPRRVIKVENGITHVDIIGDGTPGLVVSGHRENFNAHSFDVVSFYVQLDMSGTKQWQIIPIMCSPAHGLIYPGHNGISWNEKEKKGARMRFFRCSNTEKNESCSDTWI